MIRCFTPLRVIACVMVLAYHHAFDWVPCVRTIIAHVQIGSLGVNIFFVMSGYLIHGILERDRKRGVPWRFFLYRRVLRTFPPLYLLLTILTVGSLHIGERPPHWSAWTYLYNFVATGTAEEGRWHLGHLWSLCVEEHFYISWSLIVYSLGPRRSVKVLLKWVLPFSILAACMAPHVSAAFLYAHTATRMLPIGMGVLLAAHGTQFQSWRRAPHAAFTLACTSWSVLWFCGAGAVEHFASILCAAGVVGFSLAWIEPKLAHIAWTNSPIMHHTGAMTYGLYLYSLIVFGIFRIHAIGGIANSSRALTVTTIVVSLSYRYLELPLISYGKRHFTRPK